MGVTKKGTVTSGTLSVANLQHSNFRRPAVVYVFDEGNAWQIHRTWNTQSVRLLNLQESVCTAERR